MAGVSCVSVLFNEPKLLKFQSDAAATTRVRVSVLFNEPKLLKFDAKYRYLAQIARFSALQRAEIAEMQPLLKARPLGVRRFSALQRAEIAEIVVITVAALRVMLFQCSSTSRNC